MATDKVFDVEVMSVDNSGNIACDGGVGSKGLEVIGSVDINGISMSQRSTSPFSNVIYSDHPITIESNGGDITLTTESDDKIVLADEVEINDVVIMSALPTSDPVNAGQLWNDSGTLKVSAGS